MNSPEPQIRERKRLGGEARLSAGQIKGPEPHISVRGGGLRIMPPVCLRGRGRLALHISVSLLGGNSEQSRYERELKEASGGFKTFTQITHQEPVSRI